MSIKVFNELTMFREPPKRGWELFFIVVCCLPADRNYKRGGLLVKSGKTENMDPGEKEEPLKWGAIFASPTAWLSVEKKGIPDRLPKSMIHTGRIIAIGHYTG